MRIPLATYRLQFTPSFKFKQAESIIKYLSELGISDVYASPIFKAKKGSLHGYDIVDSNSLNPELGSKSNFKKLAKKVKDLNMGWIQDIVPNHAAYDCENRLLQDVLENGRNSPYADFFDIRWDFTNEKFNGKILAPFLGNAYNETLKQGEISLKYDHGKIWICYYEKNFPIRPKSYREILFDDFKRFSDILGEKNLHLLELTNIFNTLESLDCKYQTNGLVKQILELKKRIWDLYTTNSRIKDCIDENIKSLNKKDKYSLNLLDKIISDQHYKLTHWRQTDKGINYRRFFYLNDFIAQRIENEKALNYTHKLIFQFIKQEFFTGLRIDHIDGLYDPADYLEKIKNKTGDVYITVEKILDIDEKLRENWPIQGTTGYDFLNHLNGIFCKTANENKFTGLYKDINDSIGPCKELLIEKKKLIVEKYMSGDLEYLLYLLGKITESSTKFTRLKTAMVEILANLDIYRTYLNTNVKEDKEIAYIKNAIAKAKKNVSGYQQEYNTILNLLSSADVTGNNKVEKIRTDFVAFFQQFSSVATAKGFEDTFLYIYNRFISLNEVGGKPEEFGVSLSKFHDFNRDRSNKWPHTLNATATHDTKRGEDVRARLNVLSEMPKRWRDRVEKWMKINHPKKLKVSGEYAPDKNDEYFIYQTVTGAFPFNEDKLDAFKQRLKKYIIKSVREAKVHSSWIDPNDEYEQACSNFIEQILKKEKQNEFLADFFPFQKEIAQYGIYNSLSQTLIKITSPGIPDFYRGCELWDLNLVDPDNRRPVNFEKRKNALNKIKSNLSKDPVSLIDNLLSTKEDGRIKLFLIWSALSNRKANFNLFAKGDYKPLKVQGPLKEHIIAFGRAYEDQCSITIAPRFLTDIIPSNELFFNKNIWGTLSIILDSKYTGNFRNCFTDEILQIENEILLSEALNNFPVCMLLSQ